MGKLEDRLMAEKRSEADFVAPSGAYGLDRSPWKVVRETGGSNCSVLADCIITKFVAGPRARQLAVALEDENPQNRYEARDMVRSWGSSNWH